jgi:hypothetical protein
MDYNNKKVSIEIELDMNELRKKFNDYSLLSGDIVRIICKQIKMKNNEGTEIIKVVRATQLLEKQIKENV